MGNFLQKESWSFALLATSKRGGRTLLIFKWQGVMCICDSKKTKTVPESMRGRTGASLLPFLFSLSSPHFFLYLLSPSFFPSSFSFLPPLSILPPLSPFSHPLSPFIYVVMIVVNTIHTFVLLRDGNLISWWPSVIHVWSSKNVEKIVTPLKF